MQEKPKQPTKARTPKQPRPRLGVRDQVAEGRDVRPRPLANEIGASPSGLYGWISKGVVEARRIDGIVVIPNHEARRLLGMPALEAA